MSANQADTILQTLEEHVVLLALHISRWRGVYHLPEDSVAVAVDGANVATTSVTVPRARLMTESYPVSVTGQPWVARFNAVENKLRKQIDSLSVPFPIRGVRIVPLRRHQAVLDYVTAARDEMYHLAHEFVQTLPDILEQIRANTDPRVWAYVVDNIPRSPAAMAKKFNIGLIPVRLAGRTAQTLSLHDLGAYANMVQDTVVATVREAIESMITGPREELAEALRNLDELLSRSGRVTQRTFDVVRRAIDKLRAFEFVANEDLLRQIRSFEQRMQATDPRSLIDQASVRLTFRSALDSLLKEAQDEVKAEADANRFVHTRRVIELRRPSSSETPAATAAAVAG